MVTIPFHDVISLNINNSVTVRGCVCASCSLLGTPILSVVMWNQTLFDLLQMMIPLLLCR